MKPGYKNYNFLLFAGIATGAVALFLWLINRGNLQLLNPKGLIAAKESQLMISATLLMLIIVIPTFITFAVFVYRYRASNKKSKYTPNEDQNIRMQLVMWGAPILIIAILAVMNWKSTHELDPYKSLAATNAPITIQVVSLQWKWLFIYPEQNIATVNFVEFPANTPVNFQLTSDAPMNSFWIPQLGGQMYSMAGMSTHLNLMANGPGEFNGSAAEISGAGFAGMKFMAKATSENAFDAWVNSVRLNTHPLTLAQYNLLATPSFDNPVASYSTTEPGLFNSIMMKYMMPGHSEETE